MEWLGGSGYSWTGWLIHGVEYAEGDGEVQYGSYMPILFENLADPIISGREELGAPKLYSSIDVYRGINSYRVNLGWQGSMWGNLAWEGLTGVDLHRDPPQFSEEGIIQQRYFPGCGQGQKRAPVVNHGVWIPYAGDVEPKIQQMWKAKKASIAIDGKDWDTLPTIHHVVSRMGEIPVYEIVEAKIAQGVGVPDLHTSRSML